MTKDAVRAKIETLGIIPSVRTSSEVDARFAAEAVSRGGIPIVEITMTVPGALGVMAELVRTMPDVVVGAGDIIDCETARRCLDVGAVFLTGPTSDRAVIEFAQQQNVLVLPGALTPTEVMTAWRLGADFVKVFPCSQVGGHRYIQALTRPFPQVPLVAAGGITQMTAAKFILAGATAIGVGTELVPHEAIRQREREWIPELARRFVGLVQQAREERQRFQAHHGSHA
jgi:2-dehydro-3-deoxyphosphogluconate aldolase/(4S)-4-hydroxy-2-oxoglutarate aldolase